MVRSSTVTDQDVRVLDSDGTPLTLAKTRADDDDGALILAEVEDPGILLNYFFGRGERLVLIERRGAATGRVVEGTLETWWIGGERRWHVYVDRTLMTLGPVETAHPEPVGRR
jgi:hypothetical protein